jgi:cell division protein FtsB
VVKLKHLVLPTLLGLAGYYAVFGGEYSIFEVERTRARIEAETAELDRLRVRIDSLRARADSLETDSVTIERVARENVGMIRDGEVLYRFTEPDTTRGDSTEVPDPGGPRPDA